MTQRNLGGQASEPRARNRAGTGKLSRSNFSWRFSRRRRLSSSRSAVVRPFSRRPASRSACATQLRIVCPDGSNSLASSSGERPAQLYHLPAEFRRIGGCFLAIVDSENKVGCPRNRGNFSNLATLSSERCSSCARFQSGDPGKLATNVIGSHPDICPGPSVGGKDPAFQIFRESRL
jgi:hypothetical protein